MKTDPFCLDMIRDLSNAKGPSGFEDEAVLAARAYAAQAGALEEDCLRNLYIRRERNCGRPTVMLDAHSDEVGLMVHSVKPTGTLRFVSLGRWSENALVGAKMLVRNALGEWIPGVIAVKPPHFRTQAERAAAGASPAISELVLDVGARSAEEAKADFHIRIGEPIVPDVRFSYDAERDVMLGKAFDCRIGCAALMETMRRVRDMELAVDVIGSLSSQEELGERGCRVAVNKIKPKAAIVFEGCPADDTFTEPYAVQTALKKGPMLRFMDVSMIANPRFQRFALDLAQEWSIPVQASVREGGGNNGACISTALDGVPVIVMGVPVRGIHSTCGITSYYDFEAAVSMAVALLMRLDESVIAGF